MNSQQSTRPPAVAGLFYPAEPDVVKDQVHAYLQELNPYTGGMPKALIVPHAGYIYSGAIAAAAYASLLPGRETVGRVLLLGPAHRVALEGMAIPETQVFETPLGSIHLDERGMQQMAADFPFIKKSDLAHAEEHSIEVQLPFLQTILPSFKLLPLVVGDIPETDISHLIESYWSDPDVLVVISSDLSHFHNYNKAQRMDNHTASLIESFKGEELAWESACGRLPIAGLLHLARKHRMTIKRFDLRNSGDTAGDHSRVVGYGSWGLFLP